MSQGTAAYIISFFLASVKEIVLAVHLW